MKKNPTTKKDIAMLLHALASGEPAAIDGELVVVEWDSSGILIRPLPKPKKKTPRS